MDKLKLFFKSSRQPILVTLVLLLICGLLFPLLLTGLSALIFPKQAKGSLIEVDGKVIGSTYVGQDFSEPYFMKCRPSAVQYNTFTEDAEGNRYLPDGSEFGGVASGSNNYGPSNPELQKRVNTDMEEFLKANPNVKKEDIPTDLLTASGSGLDPHISVESAKIQLPAIATASGIPEETLLQFVEKHTQGKLLGVFGQETVNVLGVNLEIAKEMGLVKVD